MTEVKWNRDLQVVLDKLVKPLVSNKAIELVVFVSIDDNWNHDENEKVIIVLNV